jgi:hypothetical protein
VTGGRRGIYDTLSSRLTHFMYAFALCFLFLVLVLWLVHASSLVHRLQLPDVGDPEGAVRRLHRHLPRPLRPAQPRRHRQAGCVHESNGWDWVLARAAGFAIRLGLWPSGGFRCLGR